MLEFNIDKAKEGVAVQTRDGRPVRILCYDRKDARKRGCIVALVINSNQTYEQIVQYDQAGRQVDHVKEYDLMLV